MTKKILIGLGNPFGRDDAVGLRVAQALEGSDWLSFPTQALENVLGAVEKENPEKVVIVDAAEMGLPPGTIRRLPLDTTEKMLGSTHGLPVSFLLSLVKAPKVVLIGIQPKEYGIGEGLSPEVAEAAQRLAQILRDGKEEEIPNL